MPLTDATAYIAARYRSNPALPDMQQDVQLALAQGKSHGAAVEHAKRRYAKLYAPAPIGEDTPEQADPAPNPREQASRNETAELLGLVIALAAQRVARRRPGFRAIFPGSSVMLGCADDSRMVRSTHEKPQTTARTAAR